MDKQAEYEKLMIEAIQKYKWNRWSHIDWDILGFSRPTAYNHELDKLDTIKGAFEQNRSKNVNYLLQNWIDSDNATLQIAAMRIVADPEDRQRLNQNYLEMSGQVDTKKMVMVVTQGDIEDTIEDTKAPPDPTE